MTHVLSKDEYLKKAQDYAISRGGQCLSTEYVKAKTKMQWKCSNDKHPVWESDYDHAINRNRWCKQCAYEKGEIKDAYNVAMACAKPKGGYVIIPKDLVVTVSSILTWKCSNAEHKTWKAELRNVLNGTWCPYCAGRFSKEEYLQKAKDYAASHGGQCLSTSYENQNTYLIFKCHDPNHKPWKSQYGKLEERNTWCQQKECKDLKSKPQRDEFLKKAKEHAIKRGGECLSSEYISNNRYLEWHCGNKEHKVWKAHYNNVVGKSQRWCPDCASQFSPEEQIERARKYAKSKGGECLSNIYVPGKSLIWKCQYKDHKEWSTSINIINSKSHTWCPECGNSTYYKENNTRIILENLLGFKLTKARPEWNKNPKTKKLLELDGYNEDNKFAFEFQGRHHFEDNVYKKTNLVEVQEKDKIKAEHCKDNKVRLLVINDTKSVKTIEELISYIIKILLNERIPFNRNYSIEHLKSLIEDMQQSDHKKDIINKAHDYATLHAGKCLSTTYINSKSLLEWKCSVEEHASWKRDISIIRNGNWCRLCYLEGQKKSP